MKFGSTDISQHYVGSSLVPRIYNCEDTNYARNETAFDADVLIIGGGGGGGNGQGGGGGGGGYREFTKKYYTGTSYTVTVGAGGSLNSNGSDSSIEKIGTGGGAGGDAWGATQEACNGKDGGSGGGSGLTVNNDFRKTSGGNSISPRCNGSSQGYPGVAGPIELCSSGGAGGTGSNRNGGPGKTSTITGTSVGRAGGGAPAFGSSSATDGGGVAYQNGTVNTGGGGGGSANGGSGFVCIKFPDTITIIVGGGLTYTSSTSGGYTTVQFTAGTDTIEFFLNPKTYGGLELWLDSNDSETITLNGGTVSEWYDKSGNDYHVSQGTASNQPTYISSALNGRNVLAFDGGNDVLRNSQATPVPGSSSRTVFIVYNVTGGNGDGIFSLGYTSSSTGRQFVVTREIGIRCFFVVRTFNESNDGTTYMIVTYMLDGTTGNDLSAFKNGSALSVKNTSNGTTTINTAAGIELTNDGNSGANIAEILVYNSALSTSDRQGVESYLSSKWGIAIS